MTCYSTEYRLDGDTKGPLNGPLKGHLIGSLITNFGVGFWCVCVNVFGLRVWLFSLCWLCWFFWFCFFGVFDSGLSGGVMLSFICVFGVLLGYLKTALFSSS